MKITVVTAAYNAEQYIEKCLESVQQEVERLRGEEIGPFNPERWRAVGTDAIHVSHLVVDGNSNDQTTAILERWGRLTGARRGRLGFSATRFPERPTESAMASIKYGFSYLTEPDEGQSDGLNKGFRLAEGEWILWLNADDYLLPGSLRAFLETLESVSYNVDVLYGHYRFVNSDGELQRRLYTIPYSQFLVRHLAFLPPTSGTLFRRKILCDNPLDVTFHYTMDREWFLRCGGSLRAMRIRRELTAFRVTETSKTGNFTLHGKLSEQHRFEQRLNWKRHIEPSYSWLPSDMRGAFFGSVRLLSKVAVRLLKLSELVLSKTVLVPDR